MVCALLMKCFKTPLRHWTRPRPTPGGMLFTLLTGLARGSQGAVVGIPEYMLQVNWKWIKCQRWVQNSDIAVLLGWGWPHNPEGEARLQLLPQRLQTSLQSLSRGSWWSSKDNGLVNWGARVCNGKVTMTFSSLLISSLYRLVCVRYSRLVNTTRELARVNTWGALRETLLFPLMFVGHYVLANELNTKTGLINKSRSIFTINFSYPGQEKTRLSNYH